MWLCKTIQRKRNLIKLVAAKKGKTEEEESTTRSSRKLDMINISLAHCSRATHAKILIKKREEESTSYAVVPLQE